ncbi:DNA/RNA non-specific endonuclease [uncultured Legionella sp.]|uniref:DNA/RNA non-specific endonuclease n=1 Tax=uncultured Legionella sp. TaxID=210934 RepID=UPI002605D803|nr:DNA/RNA non-specific endonuclease [uncultured Legionella sp.]
MIEELIKELASKPCLDELTIEEWLSYSTIYQPLDVSNRLLLSEVIASHSGILLPEVTNALQNLESVAPDIRILMAANLQSAQETATAKISSMQQRTLFKRIDLNLFSISRTEWLTMISKFERLGKSNLTPVFFFSTLSAIRRISYDELTASLNKQQPERQAKRTLELKEGTIKKARHSRRHDDKENLFIFNRGDEHMEVQLPPTGARSCELTPATPDKRYPFVVRTPGGTTARPVYTRDGVTLFKHCTPIGKEPKQGRVDVRNVTTAQIHAKLPKLQLDRAHTIKFTATLAGIIQRSGMPRKISQNAQMNAKASDVFRAHGIEIQSADGRSYHWAHLIAHFLSGIEDLYSDNQEHEIINLVPSTASANYNTLEMVENFIKNKLIDEDTDKIDIEVEPVYSENALIPDMLNYKLSWTENGKKCNEIFYINPQSGQRISRSMHDTINTLRGILGEQHATHVGEIDVDEPKITL